MKKLLSFCALIILAQSCIPTSIPPRIKNYRVLKGKEIRKLKLDKKKHFFVFENDWRGVDFLDFMADKFGFERNPFIKSFDVDIENEPFTLFVHTRKKTEKSLDLLSPILFEDADADVVEGDTYHYVALSVLDQNGKDCLSEKSLYYETTIKYLRDLKKEYFVY